jgi:DNA polymerase I-like protein with 3'-5' exonuclease and polymerase domains
MRDVGRSFLRPQDWLQVPEFRWELFDPKRAGALQELFSSAVFISQDIETVRDDPERAIACIGFTAIHFAAGSRCYTATTVVVPFTDEYNIAFATSICRLPVLKVFQNGKYDNAYLLRYGITTTNWGLDTINLFHSWYSELPKDLGFITSYCLRKWSYHKDEGSSASDLEAYYEYNAKDAFTTAIAALVLLAEMPPWALTNYIMEFPLVFPCLLSELTGIAGDAAEFDKLKAQMDLSCERKLSDLKKMVANPLYNPSSSQQTLRLFTALGSQDIKTSGKIDADKVAARHPLNKRILGDIKRYREDRKMSSTYCDKEKLWNGRIYYALNPHGTDTSRLASKESAYWCGLQIQNIPRDRKDIQVKSAFCADPGFYLGEGDYEQNEAFGTAYLSGDPTFIATINDRSKDFHGRNASAFFGVPYERIVRSVLDLEEWTHETIDKELRDLSKRTNHGSNYNMGAQVLLDTMGIGNVIRARELLELPATYSLLQVTQYLLNKYAETYPVVKGAWYDKCKSDVRGSRFLVGPTGWHRYCFGNPDKSKRDLNSYVAHPPQSLAAQQLNKAYLRVFYEVWLPNPRDFKLLAQIHDSILFMYRKDREDLAWKVRDCMDNTYAIKDTFGKVRQLRVPIAMKGGGTRWSEVETLVQNKKAA